MTSRTTAMTVRVVTDSTCDLSQDVVRELGITVVPLLIHIGEDTFQDGVTLNNDSFYEILKTGSVLPKTSAPSSGMFIEAYEQLAEIADDIVSIHISASLSATYASALVARDGVDVPRRIEVIDSRSASFALGLLVVVAATMARDGATVDEIVAEIHESIPRTHFFGVLDTLDYLHRGGRIGKASTFLGSMLNIKPILSLRDGIAFPVERIRGREQALDRLCEMVGSYGSISHLAVGHTTTPEEMELLAFRLSQFYPSSGILRCRCGATIGTYFGPGALGVALITAPNRSANSSGV